LAILGPENLNFGGSMSHPSSKKLKENKKNINTFFLTSDMAPEPHRTFPVAADLKFAPPLWDLASTRAYGGSLKPSSNPGANIADSWVSHDIAPLSPKNERIQCHRKGFCGGVLSPFITRKAITVTFYAIIVDRSFPASSNGSKKPSSPTLEIGPVP
jgi:hypothetical protein